MEEEEREEDVEEEEMEEEEQEEEEDEGRKESKLPFLPPSFISTTQFASSFSLFPYSDINLSHSGFDINSFPSSHSTITNPPSLSSLISEYPMLSNHTLHPLPSILTPTHPPFHPSPTPHESNVKEESESSPSPESEV